MPDLLHFRRCSGAVAARENPELRPEPPHALSDLGDKPQDHAKRVEKKILINSLLILITDLFVILLPNEPFLGHEVLHLARELAGRVAHVPGLPLLVGAEFLLEGAHQGANHLSLAPEVLLLFGQHELQVLFILEQLLLVIGNHPVHRWVFPLGDLLDFEQLFLLLLQEVQLGLVVQLHLRDKALRLADALPAQRNEFKRLCEVSLQRLRNLAEVGTQLGECFHASFVVFLGFNSLRLFNITRLQ